MHKCILCDQPATWIRSSQFSGDHHYCLQHAQWQEDWQLNDSYARWVEVAHYELATLEGQREFDKQRGYHYTNTSNPVDFPKTTAPELGMAAILSNITYWLALAQKHQALAAEAIKQAEHWNKQIAK